MDRLLLSLMIAVAAVFGISNAQPPTLTPRPHVILSMNGSIIAGSDISLNCFQTYAQDFSNSLKDIVGRANGAISRAQICPTSSLNQAVQGDVQFYSTSSVAATVRYTVYTFPTDQTTTLRSTEICTFDLSGFFAYDNWRQPIIPGYGCPSVTFVPAWFDLTSTVWNCF